MRHCAPSDVSSDLLMELGFLISALCSLVCKGQVFMFPEGSGTYEGEGCSTGSVTEVQGCSLIIQACFSSVTPPA